MDYIPRPGNGAGMEEEIMGNSVRAVVSLRIYSRPYFVLRAMGQTALFARIYDERCKIGLHKAGGLSAGWDLTAPGGGGKERDGIIARRKKEHGAGNKKGELPACV